MKRDVLSWALVIVFTIIPFVLLNTSWITYNPNTPTVTPFHTPIFYEGLALPANISKNITVGPNNGIILIHTLITIEPGATLTILPGSIIAISEFGGLFVRGSLISEGSSTQPITLISNELHELNRHWSGILLAKNSTTALRYTAIQSASPAISCQPGAKTSLQHIAQNTFGCTIE